MLEHCLFLKVGPIFFYHVSMKSNLNVLCNGTRLIVKELHENLIVGEIITIKQTLLIARIKLAPSDVNLSFVLERRQFPVRLAYT